MPNENISWGTRLRRTIFHGLGASVYASRILLIPFYACLVMVLVAYCYNIFAESVGIILSVKDGAEGLLIKALSIVDVVMIANLIVIILIGSYSIFVRKIGEDHYNRPEWLNHISSGSLKVKISMSIVGVSSIHLLKIFIDSSGITMNELIVKLSIHAFFIISAWAMAKTNQLIEPADHHHEQPKEETK